LARDCSASRPSLVVVGRPEVEIEHRGRRPESRPPLCIHHCVEGATVGPHDFTFTTGDDVIGAGDVPSDFNVVLSGHIHRHQVLMTDLRHRPVKTPVLYPGSIERTSFAEAGETKGFMLVRLGADEHEPRVRWEFRRLPARPMLREELAVDAMDAGTLEAAVRAIITVAPPDAVLSIRIAGALTDEHWRTLSAARMRSFVPTTMNVEIAPVMRLVRQQVLTSPSRPAESYAAQLSLYDGI
jgi:DNA repair protein SbcD/Mre11